MNNDLISREALKKAITNRLVSVTHSSDYADGLQDDYLNTINEIDNAPTVKAFTEEDIKQTIKENFDIGYEMAKAKFERPNESAN